MTWIELSTLPRLVFRELACHIVKFGTIPDLCEGFFLLRVFFALPLDKTGEYHVLMIGAH